MGRACRGQAAMLRLSPCPPPRPPPNHPSPCAPLCPLLPPWCPQERRTQLFSATMTSKVAKLQRACLRDPVKGELRGVGGFAVSDVACCVCMRVRSRTPPGVRLRASPGLHAACLSLRGTHPARSPSPPPPPASPAPPAVEVASKYSTVDTLRQQYMFVPAKHKDCYLTFLLTGGWGRRGWVAAAGPGCLWRR